MSTYKVKTLLTLKHSREYYAKLFKEGEISANNTCVLENAKVHLAGTAIFLEHIYPSAEQYKQVGEIKQVYKDENNNWIAKFVIYEDSLADLVEKEDAKVSVSWFSDDYYYEDNIAYFKNITIYEMSFVSNPAFNTCIANSPDALTCVHKEHKHGCGCGGVKMPPTPPPKPNNNEKVIFANMKHQSVEERIAMLEEAVASLSEKVDALVTKYDELVSQMQAQKDSTDNQEEMNETIQNAIKEAEKKFAELVSMNNTKVESLAENLISLLETLKKL